MHISMKLKPKDIETLANRIYARRLISGHNYSEIAKLLGINQSQVSRICRGQFKTRSGNVMHICTFLGVDFNSDEPRDLVRLREAVLDLWDGTTADADRITRLLGVVAEVRRSH
jgi:DNA-binding CsgD family transcriptional regulator